MKQKIKEFKNHSEWFTSYLVEKTQEDELRRKEKIRTDNIPRNSWSKCLDDQRWISKGRFIDFTGLVTGPNRFKRKTIEESNTYFFNFLHSYCFNRRYLKLNRWIVIENGDHRGKHSHMLIEIPRHLTEEEFKKTVLQCWKKTPFSLQSINEDQFGIEPKEKRKDSFFTKHTGVFSLGFGGYTIKDKQFDKDSDLFDTKNSHWNLIEK